MENIPVFAPYIDKSTIEHILHAFEIGWLGMGAFTKEFEDRIAEYLELNGRFVVATNTGTSALHIALLAAGVSSGDEVITTSFNYVADHQAITATGAKVVMCDIRDDNLGIDCKAAEKLITSRTKAIMPLHFAGIPCDQKGVYDLAKKYNLRVIEDCCHAFGSMINNRKIGSYGDIACFSFDPVKIVTSVDGGCVVVNSKYEAEQLMRLRLLGVDKDTVLRYQNSRAWDYDVVCHGFRYHLTNIFASVGIAQLKQVEKFINSRREVCRIYNSVFKDISQLKIPQTDFSNVSPFIYYVRVLNNMRGQLIDYLKSKRIDTGIHFIPVHTHTFYKHFRAGSMVMTEQIVQEVVTLPLHSHMKKEYLERIIREIVEFFR